MATTKLTTVAVATVSPIKRVYPHVNEIGDWPAQQSTRLLWDRLHDLTEQLTAAQATIKSLTDAHNATVTSVTTLEAHANATLALPQGPLAPAGPGAPSGTGGAGGGGGIGGCTVTHPALTPIDDTYLTAAATASFKGIYGRLPTPGETGPGDIPYWVSLTDHYGPYSDGVCRAGWNRYMELRMAGQASVDPSFGDVPALYQP